MSSFFQREAFKQIREAGRTFELDLEALRYGGREPPPCLKDLLYFRRTLAQDVEEGDYAEDRVGPARGDNQPEEDREWEGGEEVACYVEGEGDGGESACRRRRRKGGRMKRTVSFPFSLPFLLTSRSLARRKNDSPTNAAKKQYDAAVVGAWHSRS